MFLTEWNSHLNDSDWMNFIPSLNQLHTCISLTELTLYTHDWLNRLCTRIHSDWVNFMLDWLWLAMIDWTLYTWDWINEPQSCESFIEWTSYIHDSNWLNFIHASLIQLHSCVTLKAGYHSLLVSDLWRPRWNQSRFYHRLRSKSAFAKLAFPPALPTWS